MMKKYNLKSKNKTVVDNESIAVAYNSSNSASKVGKHVYSVEITPKSVLIVLGTALGIYLFIKLINIFLIIFLGFVLASTLLPFVRRFQKMKLNRTISVFLAYFLFIFSIIGISVLIVLPLVNQLQGADKISSVYVTRFTHEVADFVVKIEETQLGRDLNLSKVIEDYFEKLGTTSAWIDPLKTFTALSDIGTVLGNLLLALIMSIYLVYDHDNFLDLILLRIGNGKQRQFVRRSILHLESKLGNWLIGQGTVSLIVGLLTWLLLLVLDIPLALPLALVSTLLVVIPMLGAPLAGLLLFIFALLSRGFGVALIFGAGFTFIQQIENVVLVPKIMGNVIGVKPVVVFLGIMVGLSVAGVVGAVLTVPVLVILKLGYDFYFELQRMKAEEK